MHTIITGTDHDVFVNYIVQEPIENFFSSADRRSFVELIVMLISLSS